MTELESIITELQRRVVYWQRLQAAFPPDNHITHVDVAARILTYKECIEIVQDQLAVMAVERG